MSEWGRATYGDPCHQCGFRWSMSQAEAVTLVTATPAEFALMLTGIDGSLRHPDLAWPVVGYVCHVADNLRIWAERLVGLARDRSGPVAPYDQDRLAEARHYEGVALAGALWGLERAAADWTDAVGIADRAGVVLVHPDRGAQAIIDVVRSNAHDACHHRWDLERTVDSGGR